MATPCDSPLILWMQRGAAFAGVLVAFLGLLVLVGWALAVDTLKSILPIWVTMKANTAGAFLLAGASLAWLALSPSSRGQFRAHLGPALVALIGLLTFSQYLFGWDLGIDQLLFRESTEALGTSHPGRMAPTTALGFA